MGTQKNRVPLFLFSAQFYYTVICSSHVVFHSKSLSRNTCMIVPHTRKYEDFWVFLSANPWELLKTMQHALILRKNETQLTEPASVPSDFDLK